MDDDEDDDVGLSDLLGEVSKFSGVARHVVPHLRHQAVPHCLVERLVSSRRLDMRWLWSGVAETFVQQVSRNPLDRVTPKKGERFGSRSPAPVWGFVGGTIDRQYVSEANPILRLQSNPLCRDQDEPAWETSQPLQGGQCVETNTEPTPLPDALIISASLTPVVGSIAMPTG